MSVISNSSRRTCSLGIVALLGTLLGGICPAALNAQVWEAPVREVPAPNLPGIAIVSWDAAGPIIYFNPIIAQQVGPALSAFFRAHEYGHIKLNHIQREFFEANPFNRAWVLHQHEHEADCYAARALVIQMPQAVEAAIRFFDSMGPEPPDWYHPPGYDRAAVIRMCIAQPHEDHLQLVLVPCTHFGPSCRRLRPLRAPDPSLGPRASLCSRLWL